MHQPHILCITSYPPHPPRHRLNQPIVPGDQWPASKFAVMLIDLCLPAEPAAGKSTGRNSRLITSIRSTCVCVNNRMHQPLCVQHCPSIASVTNTTSFSSNKYTGWQLCRSSCLQCPSFNRYGNRLHQSSRKQEASNNKLKWSGSHTKKARGAPVGGSV